MTIHPSLSERRLALICRVLILLLLLTLAGLYSVHLGVDQMWDVKNYHLYNPYASLNDRYLYDAAPAQLQSFLNPMADYPLFFMVQKLNHWPRLIAFISGSVHGLNLFFIALITWELLGGIRVLSRVSKAVFSAIAVFTGATGAGFSPLVGTFTGDLLVSIPVLAALYVVLRELRVSADAGRVSAIALAVAGGALGIAVGLKLTMAIYTIAMMPAIFLLPRNAWIKSVAVSGAGFVVGLILAAGEHFYRMFILFQSPTFPYFNNWFKSPYREPEPFTDARFLPKSLSDWLFYPVKWAIGQGGGLVSEMSFQDIRVSVAFLSIAILLVVWCYRRRDLIQSKPMSRAIGALIIFVIIAYVVWLGMFSIYRYLIVIELLSGVLFVLVAASFARTGLGIAAAVALSAFCFATTKPMEWGHGRFGQVYLGVDAPVLPKDTLVIIVGREPVSYIIPFFDKNIRWISIASNFLNLGLNNRLIQFARETIQSHQGPIRIFEAGGDVSKVAEGLGLKYSATDCADVVSTIEAKPYRLCTATR